MDQALVISARAQSILVEARASKSYPPSLCFSILTFLARARRRLCFAPYPISTPTLSFGYTNPPSHSFSPSNLPTTYRSSKTPRTIYTSFLVPSPMESYGWRRFFWLVYVPFFLDTASLIDLGYFYSSLTFYTKNVTSSLTPRRLAAIALVLHCHEHLLVRACRRATSRRHRLSLM